MYIYRVKGWGKGSGLGVKPVRLGLGLTPGQTYHHHRGGLTPNPNPEWPTQRTCASPCRPPSPRLANWDCAIAYVEEKKRYV